MELYQRLLQLVELLANNSQTKFASQLEIPQATFNNYMNSSGQLKIRKALLDKILLVYPQINRDWLYFGEGEMLTDGLPKAASAPQDREALEARVRELEAELMEERRLNRRLTERLLDADKPGKGAP